jgi:hypothetical protein
MTAPDRNRRHAKKCLTARRRPHMTHRHHWLPQYPLQRRDVQRRLPTQVHITPENRISVSIYAPNVDNGEVIGSESPKHC